MTAEVIVLNRSAAVFAADSAVTVIGPRSVKTYSSASKISAISHDPPVGALVYGDSEILGIPWENLLSMYQDVARNDVHATTHVQRLAEGFFDWIDTQGEWLFAQASEVRATRIARDALRTMSEVVLLGKPVDVNAGVTAYAQGQLATSSLDPKAADQRARLLQLHGRAVRSQIVNLAGRLTRESLSLSESTILLLQQMVAEAIRHEALGINRGFPSGIAFAGLGTRQFHPEVVTFRVAGSIDHRIQFEKDTDRSGTVGDLPARIVPLGQSGAIRAFLQGIHPTYQERLDRLLDGLSGSLTTVVGAALKNEGINIQPFASKIQAALEQAIVDGADVLDSVKDELRLPILETISSLPTPELVAAADTLVTIEAIRARIGPVLETVGLPVDIAVASKSDGFVWVRRKHYFPTEPNSE